MNRILYLALVSHFVFVACTEITFREPQPKGIKTLSEVPQKIRGSYHFIEADPSDPGASLDTLVIVSNGYRVGYYDQTERAKAPVLEAGLSDTLTLKYYKGYYFANYREQNESDWSLRILKLLGNGDLLFFEMPQVPDSDALKKDFLNKLSMITPIDTISTDYGHRYRINPTPRQLMTLLRKDFMPVRTLKRVK